MSINQELMIITSLILLGAFFTAYIIYGRVKRKPLLLGDYKPGAPGYNEFIKLVDNNWYLIAAIVTTVLSTIAFTVDAINILNSPYSKIVLIGSPLTVVISFLVIFWIAPYVVGTKATKSKKAGKK